MSTLDSFDEDVTKLSVEGVFAIAYDCAILMERRETCGEIVGLSRNTEDVVGMGDGDESV